jgi:WhiB family redox-sensing transcriptional regulator
MIRDYDWQRFAACRDVPAEWFFPLGDRWTDADRPDRAKAVCTGCPVRAECLADALDRGDRWAILGGLDPVERAALTRRPAA